MIQLELSNDLHEIQGLTDCVNGPSEKQTTMKSIDTLRVIT